MGGCEVDAAPVRDASDSADCHEDEEGGVALLLSTPAGTRHAGAAENSGADDDDGVAVFGLHSSGGGSHVGLELNPDSVLEALGC